MHNYIKINIWYECSFESIVDIAQSYFMNWLIILVVCVGI